ncbi:hypothetical protein [Aeromonas cavernicola]|uniref:hypothetical protein n=1 Tax=Aeromonas cavernicola TaxID=1006623 RepID=UPI0012FDCE3E|nr:hypothetical protein [Aeromonas cavernicola]
MKINKLLILLSLIMVTFISKADNEDRKIKNVVGVFNEETNLLINSQDVYGDIIRYYIPSDMRNLVINLPSQVFVAINLEQEIEYAISMWQRQQQGSRRPINFMRSLVRPTDTRYIGYRLGTTTDSYGNTNYNSPSNNDAITRVVLQPRTFELQMPRRYHMAINAGDISRETDISDFTRMMVRLTIIHETGHALGLLHHDDDIEQNFNHPTRVGRRIVNCPLSFTPPSIMISGRNNTDYFTSLRRHLGRSVTLADISPSRNDIDGAHIMFHERQRPGFFNGLATLCLAVYVALRGSDL